MIIGIGSDIADIRRIEESINRFGDRFIGRIFTDAEQATADGRKAGRIPAYAKRFAAKEACSKALGTGIASGVSWQDIEVSNLATGAPLIALSGGAARRLVEITPEGAVAAVHLSLSDDFPLAQATVIIYAHAAALGGLPAPSGGDAGAEE